MTQRRAAGYNRRTPTPATGQTSPLSAATPTGATPIRPRLLIRHACKLRKVPRFPIRHRCQPPKVPCLPIRHACKLQKVPRLPNWHACTPQKEAFLK